MAVPEVEPFRSFPIVHFAMLQMSHTSNSIEKIKTCFFFLICFYFLFKYPIQESTQEHVYIDVFIARIFKNEKKTRANPGFIF